MRHLSDFTLVFLLFAFSIVNAEGLSLPSVSRFETSAALKANSRISVASEKRVLSPPDTGFEFSRQALPSLKSMPRIDLRKDYRFEDGTSLKKIAPGGGGANGGGGGGGVLCYPNGQEHDQKSFNLAVVFEAWDWTHLAADSFNRIEEVTRFGQYFPVEPKTITFENYLKTIVYGRWGFRYKNPLFAKILIQTIDEVLSQTHQCRDFSTYVDDRGRIFPNEIEWMKSNNCSPVQLAWRSPKEGDPTRSKIEFNCKLFNRLGIKDGRKSYKTVNQALLILHEALYLMGSRLLTHPTSENIRRLINISMTPSGQNEAGIYQPSDSRRLFRQLEFDDYFRLNPSDPLKDKVKISRQQSYRSAVKIIGNLRRLFLPMPRELNAPDSLFFTDPDKVFRWILENDPAYSFYASEQTKIKEARMLFAQSIIQYGIPAMTDEEAFLYAASIYSEFADSENKYNPDATFEHLLTAGENDSNIRQSVCAYVRNRGNRNRYLEALQSKTESYCKTAAVQQ